MEIFQKKIEFKFKNHLEVLASLKKIIDEINLHGFVLLSMKNNDEKTFKDVMNYFGNFQKHIRSDINGIVGVNKSSLKKVDEAKEKYSGLNKEKFPPHTDGSYLNGLLKINDSFTYIGPPSLLALQCEEPAWKGGENILVDAKQILKDILKNEKELLPYLLKQNCFTICRDDQIAMNFPLFEYFGKNNWRIRFRSDKMVYGSEQSVEALKRFIKNYTLNEKYYKYLSLKSGQILIIDNFRILHGREAFTESDNIKKRSIRRIWINEFPTRNYFNILENVEEHRVFKNYNDYKIISNQFKNNTLNLGIKLNTENNLTCLKIKNRIYESF